MASNQTNQAENLKQLIRNWCTAMLQVHESFLEAYKDNYNHGDFVHRLFTCESSDPEQFHQILMDIRSLGRHQRSMENLQQQMAETGLSSLGLFNGFNMHREKYLLTALVKDPLDKLGQRIGDIVSNARFVKSQYQKTNSPIFQFKYEFKVQQNVFKIKKQGLKCF